MTTDNENEQDTQDVQAAAPKAPEDLYYVHNVTRGRHNRTLRASGPKHHGLKQFIGGGKYRSIRGRPIMLSREQVGEHIEELVKKVDAGIFEVRTHDGRIVDMRTGDAAPRGASQPLPRPVLDSIANDTQNVGQLMPQFAGGDVEGTDGSLPSLIASAEGELSAETPPPPIGATPPATSTPEVPPPPPPADDDAVPGEDQTAEGTSEGTDVDPDALPGLLAGDASSDTSKKKGDA